MLSYELPLGEIVIDFYDQLKSRTRGYASFDYDLAGFREGDLTRSTSSSQASLSTRSRSSSTETSPTNAGSCSSSV